MAVLKRFSYDNIVEHNPTAPDPVEGGGGGAGLFFIALTEEGEEGSATYTINCTYDDIIDAINSGLLPVVIKNGTIWLYLAAIRRSPVPSVPDNLTFYSIIEVNNDGTVRAHRCRILESDAITYERIHF